MLRQLVVANFPPQFRDNALRVGCYNIRVDHHADEGTGREWMPHRRPLATVAIRKLDCDLLLVQEPGLRMCEQLAADLGSDVAVKMQACDPSQWTTDDGPKQGQEFDGNGFIWKPDRLELLGDVKTFWFSTTPEAPGGPAWDSSPYNRCGMEARFRVRGHPDDAVIHAITAHFDHVGEEARVQSAKMAMQRAGEACKAPNTIVILGGDFNTFPDSGGPETYNALVEAGEAVGMLDVRVLPALQQHLDFGVGSSSWKGWKGEKHSREENEEKYPEAGQHASRFDHVFLSQTARVNWTGVLEEPEWAPASDHVPIVLELAL